MNGVRTMKTILFLFAALLLALAGCSSSKEFSYADAESAVIPAERWGGVPAADSLARRHVITHITLHHQGEPFPRGKDPQQYLRNLQSWSRSAKNWIDIPYHYIIDLDGNVYEGRRIEYAGDTNTEYDPSGHALIEVVGNFEEVEPNQEQLDAVVRTMTWLAVKYNVPPDSIRAHKDYSSKTVCPGKNLYRYIENGYFRDAVTENLRRRQP
ncbi:MAG: N-acetylmuramoyl-L-alanine amidase [Bacteroidetes bacterium]|nr:MAG: N-acetylmuramoyl-L-alanine amidase [Bacteroidota bacterium]